MELVEGTTLALRLNGLDFEVSEARRIGYGLLDALEAYHAQDLAHSDLHDENVMISRTTVKVLDPIYFSSSSLRSTATRESVQARDLRSLRDLLVRLLERTSISPEDVATFSKATIRSSSAVLRAEFDKALTKTAAS